MPIVKFDWCLTLFESVFFLLRTAKLAQPPYEIFLPSLLEVNKTFKTNYNIYVTQWLKHKLRATLGGQ